MPRQKPIDLYLHSDALGTILPLNLGDPGFAQIWKDMRSAPIGANYPLLLGRKDLDRRRFNGRKIPDSGVLVTDHREIEDAIEESESRISTEYALWVAGIRSAPDSGWRAKALHGLEVAIDSGRTVQRIGPAERANNADRIYQVVDEDGWALGQNAGIQRALEILRNAGAQPPIRKEEGSTSEAAAAWFARLCVDALLYQHRIGILPSIPESRRGVVIGRGLAAWAYSVTARRHAPV
ncbi:hypothetical protein [Thioalkalivibrio sp. ALE16]|uniref:hypothetical protein n=1 Tax=Thioalkalivibrio sp. ALE16 TaxID=1158172 RepID=UPI000360DFAC|nr:hypothetical protein [Thioalkalivibrio sp. ALE16]